MEDLVVGAWLAAQECTFGESEYMHPLLALAYLLFGVEEETELVVYRRLGVAWSSTHQAVSDSGIGPAECVAAVFEGGVEAGDVLLSGG